MPISRLVSIAPDLEAAISAASPAVRVSVASFAASWAAGRVGWSQPGGSVSLATVAEELDDHYLSLQESVGGPDAEVTAAFGRARAASCAAFAAEGNASEAVYEAIMATGDLPGARDAISSALSGPSATA